MCLMGEDEMFGEEDIILKGPRSIGVRCVSAYGELYFMKRNLFVSLMMQHVQT